MVRRITALIIVAASFGGVGCKKKSQTTENAKTAEAPKVGCGSDYADPDKQFCVKLPTGYTFEKANKEDNVGLRYEFKGPEQYFNVLVWGEPTFTYQYQLDNYGPLMKKPDHTDVQSGGTPGQTQWWTYKFGTETPLITALAKAASGMAIQCEGDANPVAPEVIEACKTLRPYPGGAAAPAAAGSGAAK